MKNKFILIFTTFILMILIPFLVFNFNLITNLNQFIKNTSSSLNNISSEETSSLVPAQSIPPCSQNEQGKFKILDETNSQIIEVPDKEFMYGAVATEMPPTFCEEAIKAQAVATYTYFCRQRENERKSPTKNLNGADLTANTKDFKTYTTKDLLKERWKDDFDRYYQKETSCIDSVFNQVLKSDGELALTMYHAISSGNTECCKDVFGGDKKYLVSVVSPGDLFAPSYKTSKKLDINEFKSLAQEKWPDITFQEDPSLWVTNIERTDSGCVKNIKIGSISTTGQEVRNAFSLRSSDFEVNFCDEKFDFTVYGYGHCVGMSQYGAEYMAKQGADYKQILNWYYPGTSIYTLS